MTQVQYGESVGRAFVALNKLEIGKSVAGYLKTVTEETGKFGSQLVLNLVSDKDGTEFKVYVAGNVKNFAKNFAMSEGLVSRDERFTKLVDEAATFKDCLITMTRLSDKFNDKLKKNVANFKIERDTDKKLGDFITL